MSDAPAGGSKRLDPQAAIAKYAATTQAGGAGDVAIIARVENSIKHSPMGWLQGVLGETGSRASSETSEVHGKIAEHQQLVSANQKDAPKDAGPPPAPGPAAHPAVPHPQTAAPGPGPTRAAAPAAGATEHHAVPAHAPGHAAAAHAPAAAPAPTIAGAVAGAGDAQLDGILNGYTPKSPQATQTMGRIKQMGDVAQGFTGQLDTYIARGDGVEHAIAGASNFLGVGKDASAVWAQNPYRKVHGILGGIMTGLSSVKSVCAMVGSICGKLGMILTVIGLLGMIFPPIGAAVSGIARILNVVGVICSAISFVLSGILTGLNGVNLAQQIGAGASAEEKAATADLMMTESNDAASGFVNLAMTFGPKFMKGMLGSSKGIVSSLLKRAKATIGRVSLKVSGNVSHFANRIVRKLGFGGAGGVAHVGGAWKETGMLAGMKERLASSAVGRAYNGAPAHIQGVQDKLMAKYGNTAWAKNMDRVGAWGGSAAHRFDLEDKVGKLGERSGARLGAMGAETDFGKRLAASAERSELQTRELGMQLGARDAAHLEEARWKRELERRAANAPAGHLRSADAEKTFIASRGDKVRREEADTFAQDERRREQTERLEKMRTERFDRRNHDFSENRTNGLTGESKRDEMMGSVHNSRQRRWDLEAQFKAQETERKDLLGKATKSSQEQARLTQLNGELRTLDEARRLNKLHEKDLSGIAMGAERVREPEYKNWKDVASNGWEAVEPMQEMLGLQDKGMTVEAIDKKHVLDAAKFDRGTAKSTAAGRGGHGTFGAIAKDPREAELQSITEFVHAQRRPTSVSGSVRGMLSSITNRPAAAPHAAAPSTAPMPQPMAAAPREHMTVTPQVHAEQAPAPAEPHAAPHAEPVAADADAGEALPYWPALIPEFDKAQHDFGWMRKTAVEFKKAQIEGKQKAVNTLAVYGRYKEYAQARAASAAKNQQGAAQTGQATQQNAAHAQQTEDQAGQGEAKQSQAKGAASDKAATDLPEPASTGFWGNILGAVKRWAKNKAAQVFGWIQEKIASVVLQGLCGVSMGDMREYAGALRHQQQLAHGVADGAGKTSGQVQSHSVKLGSDANKEAQDAADAIGECDKNILDADTFMADVSSFEHQLAEEKAHAQVFIHSVHTQARAEQAQRAAEAAAKEQERQRASALAMPAAAAGPAGPAMAEPAAALPVAEPASGHGPSPEDEQDASQIKAASAYVSTEAGAMTSKIEARADDYTNQLAFALMNRTGKDDHGVDLKAPAKQESKHIVEAFKEEAKHTTLDMDAMRGMTIDASHAHGLADSIIQSASHLESSYDQSENALDELFARTYKAIKEGKRTLKSTLLEGDNVVGHANEAGREVDKEAVSTALPKMTAAWDTVAKPIAAPEIKPPLMLASSPTLIARKEVDSTLVPPTNATLVTAAVGTSIAAGPLVLVDDGAVQVALGQLRKRDFLAKVEPALKAAASEELGILWSVAACPYIQHYLTVYGARPAQDLERFVRRYTGSKATDPGALMNDIVTRVRLGVREWKATGRLPADVAAADPAVAAAAGGGGGPQLQKKSASGSGVDATEPAIHVSKPEKVLQQLGDGAQLDSNTMTRMNEAFGTSFADVRIHADAQGGALANEHNAHAFAVGSHVAFAPGKYQPGSVEGDALLAHELTHVIQQRGATAAPGKDVSTPGDAHEQEADKGAEAAVSRIHGSTSDRAEAKTSSDLQLSRCEGTAEAPTIHRGFHEQVYTWNGDSFALIVDWMFGNPNDQSPTQIILRAKYFGKDDVDRPETLTALDVPAHGRKISPKVTPNQADGWSKLIVDPFGDGSWLGSFTHEVISIDGWNPKSRKHVFGGKGPVMTAAETEVNVKSASALPGTQENVGSPNIGESTRALRVDVAAMSTKTWLDEICDDKTYAVDGNAVPWAPLRQKVNADAAKYTSASAKNSDEALRLTRVGEVISHARPMLRALGAANKKEAYLPDIADKAMRMVSEVQAEYGAAISASWDGPPATSLAIAEVNFNSLWYRLSGLYLEKGQGVDRMTADAAIIAQQANDLRAGKLPYYQNLYAALGVGMQKHGKSDRNKTADSADKVRSDFVSGKTGSLAGVQKLVEDTQLYTGLASLLCTSGAFRSYREEMAGIVGGAGDKIGRDLSKVCDDYVQQFEKLASPVESSLAGAHDLHNAGPDAVSKFTAVVTSDTFKKDREAIESRIKTIQTVQMLGKVLAVVGVAALTSGAAGAAFAGALEGAGAGATVVAGGEFAAEVVTFTAVNRLGNEAVLGQKPTTGWGEDLATNALMMGFLKASGAAYGKVFRLVADPKVYKATYAVGGAVTGMVALQAFAEAHFRLKEGKFMDGDERLRGLVSNAIMLAALSLGGYLAKPLNARIKSDMLVFTAKNLPGRLEAVEVKIAGLKGEVDQLKGSARSPDHAAEVLKKIEKLWNEEVSVLNEAAKAEKERKLEANKAFQDTINDFVHEIGKLDLELASAGLEVDLGATKTGNFFRPLSPNYIAFRADGMEILEAFYKEKGGKLEKIPGKDGMWVGKAEGETKYFVADGQAESFFDAPKTKIPTEKEATANHERARKEADLLAERGKQAKELVRKEIVRGHCKHRFTRIVCGTGPAAAMDANTLPGAQKGKAPTALKSLPDTIGVGIGKNTFEKLDQVPIGQSATEVNSKAYADGAQPSDFSPDHGVYAPASVIADATVMTQYRSGVPILDGSILEVTITKDTTWTVQDAHVRIKMRIDGAEVFLYGDATDLATGLGPPRELPDTQISNDPNKAQTYRTKLETTGRLINGDTVGQQKGGARVLVSGGSATGAWNAKVARQLGAMVDWIAYDPASRSGNKLPPRVEAASGEYKLIQEKLDAGGLSAEESQRLIARQAELRAFEMAMLPRNVESRDDAFNDGGIARQVKEIASLTPCEDVPGETHTGVKVQFSDGSIQYYDQVVTSHGTNATAKGDAGGPKGAVTLADSLEMTVVEVNGEIVALESVNPKGAVRVLGAAMWSPSWIETRDGSQPCLRDPAVVARYRQAMTNQALTAPRDSPGNPLLHNVGRQIVGANTVLSKN